MSVELGLLNNRTNGDGWAGFRIGIKGRFDDYRDAAVHGVGLDAGVTSSGSLILGESARTEASAELAQKLFGGGIRLQLEAAGTGNDNRLILSAWSDSTELARLEQSNLDAKQIAGLIALVSDFSGIDSVSRNSSSAWYTDWRATGSRLAHYPDREFGPILFAQHTLSRGVMKLTAQMPPLSPADSKTVDLQVRDIDGRWTTIATEPIDPLARTATFRIDSWDDTRNIPYRLRYSMYVGAGATEDRYFDGLIPADPVGKPQIVIAAFTGNNDLGFPNNEIVAHVSAHNPDLLFFSGDQIYERVGGYGFQREPIEKSILDYLRKWYLYGWEYRELLRRLPTVSIPDDHDVYQGNLWGEGGRPAKNDADPIVAHDSGGYVQPPEWVRAVEKTQTSHLPDPYDPTPVEQGIGVYYTELVYGGVSFAVIEDRKFKSAPRRILPPEANVRNGWALNPEFQRPEQFDSEQAQLLGERQIAFLESWVNDWSGGIWMKVLLSQTIFSTVATLPAGATSDSVIPSLPILKKGEYPPDDRPVRDMDSNGWPKRERDRVLRILRKGFVFHIAGDQHLGSTIQYGVENWEDAGFALCVPSISNYFPRRWFPQSGPVEWDGGGPRNLGRFIDGFGNRMTVRAVANPYDSPLEPGFLYDRAPGYGLVQIYRDTREIEMANWPREADPTSPDARPYDGWPVRFHQLDNYLGKPAAFLPGLEILGSPDPVVQVIDPEKGEVVYTVRIKGSSFRPPVPKRGRYTVVIGEGESAKRLDEIETDVSGGKVIRVQLQNF
ncbi:MAG: hypothetical protein Kow001_11780 [Acidobacteriota bacterium]